MLGKKLKKILTSLGIVLFLLKLVNATSAGELSFNDTLFSKQWPLTNTGQTILRRSGELFRESVEGTPGVDINWLNPSEIKKLEIPNDREIVVAVLDSGLDLNHPDLKDRVYFDKNICPDGEDNSNKPCRGINVLKRNADLTDDTGHGTHVAGIIAAVGNNALGVHGVTDSRVKILPIKVLSQDTTDFIYNGRLITDIFADGIIYAIQRGAQVINMSIGWPKLVETPKVRRALKLAEERNVAVIAAAGNNNKEIPTFPCTNEFVICVGAVDNQGKITEFSNFGGKVDILAPGEFIVSTYPREGVESRILRIIGYETKNGTSQASPFVAAIAASLKLTNPEMTNDELKARLFSSAKEMELSRDQGKFSKYGMVDMKAAHLNDVKPFAMPVYKDLLDLNYDLKDGRFFFSLPIRSLVGDFSDLKVSVKFNREDIALEDSEQPLNLSSGQQRSVLFKGQLKDLKKDTHFRLTVNLSSESHAFQSQTETTLIFARDLSREGGAIKERVEGFDAPELTFFRGVRKAVRVKPVLDQEGWMKAPAFYLERPKNESEEKTVLSLVQRKDGKWQGRDLEVAKKHEVVGVRISDLNLDGVADYLVTAVNKNQDRITFDYFFQKDGKTDLKKTYSFALLDYERFPVEYNQFGELLLLTRKVEGKLLKLPAFYEAYTMPEADNTFDILDRVPEDFRAYHLYFLNPKSNANELELRVVDSLDQLNQIREDIDAPSWLPLTLEKPFPQSQEERRQGTVSGLVALGEEFEREYFSYNVSARSVEMNRVFFDDRFVSGNSVRPLLSLNSQSLGVATGDVEFLAQLKRDQVRSYVWSPKSLQGQALLLDTKKWSDPVFNMIASFKNEDRTRFVETRYFIQSFDQKNAPQKLRINRESSFPGVQFSETLEPVAVVGEGINHPGVFINSTLIFGNRLYTMVEREGEFLRPLQFSVDIPENCIHMKPAKIEGIYNYLMLCRNPDGTTDFHRLPLKL